MSEWKMLVKAGPRDYADCPVSAELPEGAEGPFEVVDGQSGKEYPAQEADGRVWWMLDCIARGGTRALTLRRAKGEAANNVEVRDAFGQAAEVSVRGQYFTSYRYAEVVRPYLHPLMGPFGAPVTRRWPMEDAPGETNDHPHHKGCWVAWGEVNDTDHWSENEARHAWIVHRDFAALGGGPVFGRIRSVNDWVDRDRKPVLEEEREHRFYDLPQSGRAFDLRVTFRATQGDVRFGDTKEGGIASVRVASTMDGKAGGRIVNSCGGTGEAETWGKRAHWCDYSGPVEGDPVGVAIMDAPGNFRYPTYWHVRDYGLMTANPFGVSYFTAQGKQRGPDGSLVLPKGGELTFRYRVFVHAGDAEQARVAQKYHHFVNPPKVEVVGQE